MTKKNLNPSPELLKAIDSLLNKKKKNTMQKPKHIVGKGFESNFPLVNNAQQQAMRGLADALVVVLQATVYRGNGRAGTVEAVLQREHDEAPLIQARAALEAAKPFLEEK